MLFRYWASSTPRIMLAALRGFTLGSRFPTTGLGAFTPIEGSDYLTPLGPLTQGISSSSSNSYWGTLLVNSAAGDRSHTGLYTGLRRGSCFNGGKTRSDRGSCNGRADALPAACAKDGWREDRWREVCGRTLSGACFSDARRRLLDSRSRMEWHQAPLRITSEQLRFHRRVREVR